MSTRPLVVENHVVDTVLERHGPELGQQAGAYRNHVYRAMNYHLILIDEPEPSDEIALAWATHDLGVWTSGWDYIAPSVQLVHELASEFGIGDASGAAAMVEQHHKVRSLRDPIADAFRRADRTDAARGHVRGDLSRDDVRRCVEALPYLGFHRILLRTGASWALSHPLKPLPMLRW